MSKGTQALRKVAVAGAVQPPPSNSSEHHVAVAGASGRMGQMLIEAIRASDDCRLAGALDQPNLPGTIDVHPNWRQRLPLDNPACFADPAARLRLDAMRGGRGRP